MVKVVLNELALGTAERVRIYPFLTSYYVASLAELFIVIVFLVSSFLHCRVSKILQRTKKHEPLNDCK